MGSQICPKLYQTKNPQKEKVIKQDTNHDSIQSSLNLRKPDQLDKLFQIRVQQNTDMSLRVKNHLTNEQLREKYMEMNNDERRFYEILSVDMNSFYMDLTKESIQMLMMKKANEDQIKIRLCQNILIFSLDVFKVLGQNRNYNYELHTFQSYSETQTKLAEYLKNKYPRSDKLYYPGELAKKFTDFNMTGKIQNDCLNNSETYFTDRSELGVIKTLKIFFNKVFNELNQKFPKFEKLLQQKIFHYEEDGKQIHLHYYINRKIPQNVAKFQIDDSLQFPITSPEVFRTIIKWTEYLQDLFAHPEQNLKKMETFKIYNVRDDVVNQTIINAEQVTGLFPVLLKRFTSQKREYRNYQKLKTDIIHQFNRNLLKILFSQEIVQKYIPKQQANVMKYAYFNTRMVTWAVKEMLVYFIQKLIQIGSQIELQSKVVNVNLTNFMVSDLFRSKVIGTKKQIMFVFNNILNQQKQGQLRVIKIKNRLGTLLNDVMVIFLMTGSFIVCELQLVLSEGQKVNERIKNIQFMHHYLYELERTPYGVLAEVSSNLGYHDTKISFCQKIEFEKINEFEKCLKNQKEHQIKIHRLQRQPIICMNCCKYYDPYNCMFEIKECIKCHTFKCSKCEEDNNIKYQIDKIFFKQFYRQLRGNEFETLEYINSQIFIEDRIKLNQIRKRPGQSLKSKAIHHFLNDKEYNTIINNESLKRQKQIVFIVAKFTGSILKIKQFYYNESQKQYLNCFKPSEVISEVKPAMCSEFDFMMFFQTEKMISVKQDAISNYHLLSLEKINLDQIETFYVIQVPQFHQVAILLNFDKKSGPESLGNKKKQSQFNSIHDRLKKQPAQFIFVRQNLVLVNEAIDCQQLREFFDINASIEYKAKLKQVNLSNNLIKNASPLFLQCPNLKKISLSRNYLTELNLKEFHIPDIQTLILNENELESVDGIENLSSLQKLNLNDNNIMNIKILRLSKIQHICISNNKFDSIQWLEYSSLPNLKILEANSTGVSVTRSHQYQSLTFKFPKLRQLLFNDNILSILNVESTQIQYLSANKCEMDRIHLKMNNLTYLSLADNEIQNLEDILNSDMPNLMKLKLSNGGKMPLLPIIQAQKLTELDISRCNLFNVNSLQISKIPQISIINISQNKEVRSIPKIEFRELRIFNTKGLRLKNINFLNESKLRKVQELMLSGSGKGNQIEIPNQAPFILDQKIVMEVKSSNQQAIIVCPAFNFPRLKKLHLSIFNFSDLRELSNSSLVELNQLCLEQMKLKQLPRLRQIPAMKSQQSLQFNSTKEIKSFSNLRTLILRDIQTSHSQQFEESNFSNLQYLQINNSNLNLFKMVNHRESLKYIHIQRMPVYQIPLVDCPKCQSISFINCKLKNIFELEKYNMAKIKQLDLSCNNIKVLPNLANLKTLTSLNLKKNQIQDITSLSLTKEQIEYKFRQNLTNVLAFAEKQKQQMQLKQQRKLRLSSVAQNPFEIEGFQILDEIMLQYHGQSSEKKQNSYYVKKKTFDYQIFQFLEKLDVSSNRIKQISHLRFKILKSLNINYNPIESLSSLADEKVCHLENLLEFELIGLNNLTNIALPEFKLERAEQITIYDCNITNFRPLQNWSINQAQSIIIGSARSIQIPILRNLVKLKLFICTSLGQNKLRENAEQSAIQQIKDLKHEVNVDFEKQLLTLAQKKVKPQQYVLDNTNQSLSYLSEQSPIIEFDLSLMSLWQCPNIQKIMIKNIQMQYLPKLCINQLQNLLIIRCAVQKLDQFNESSLPNLNNLVFHRVTQLKYLSIAQKVINNGSIFAYDCDIQQVSPFLDCKCKNIVLKNNKISVMGLMKLRQTSNLSIQNNDVKNLNFVQKADKLKKIVLRMNKLTEFPQLKFPVLTELNLNENYLKYLDLKQSNFPQLEYLIANHNKSLSKVSKITIESLHQIDFSYNALREVNFFSPQYKIHLNQLNLSNNLITNIQYLPPSKEIKLNNNPLMSMKWLTNTVAQSLQYLNLSQTQFQNFQFFGNINLKFQSLIILDLSYNQGSSFPCFQQYFSHLLQLNLSHNNFQSINEFPNGNFPSLERLNISFNKLKTFTTSLRKIKILNLQNNQLEKIRIKSASSIRKIILDDNRLESAQFIKEFPCLNTLTAANNMITQVPCLMYNDNLKYLILEGNPLHKFEPFFQTKFDNLDQLRFTYSINPMLLPGHIEYIQTKMEKVNILKKKFVTDRNENAEFPLSK